MAAISSYRYSPVTTSNRASRSLGDRRAMAVWALWKLLPADAFARLRERHLADECDAAVTSEWRRV